MYPIKVSSLVLSHLTTLRNGFSWRPSLRSLSKRYVLLHRFICHVPVSFRTSATVLAIYTLWVMVLYILFNYYSKIFYSVTLKSKRISNPELKSYHEVKFMSNGKITISIVNNIVSIYLLVISSKCMTLL